MIRADYCSRWSDPTYADRVRVEGARIKSDGCSGVLDFYLIVCTEHDIGYGTHKDFFTGLPITEEDADLMLKWGIQWHSWLGRWSPIAWVRYRALSRVHGLGLGKASWATGPARLAKRLKTR